MESDQVNPDVLRETRLNLFCRQAVIIEGKIYALRNKTRKLSFFFSQELHSLKNNAYIRGI